MVAYIWDGRDVVGSFRRWSAKRHNITRQPRVALLVPDGRRALTVYGDADFLEDDPARVEAYEAILARFGAPATPRDQLATQLDAEQRVIARIRPTSVDLHDFRRRSDGRSPNGRPRRGPAVRPRAAWRPRRHP
jgi:hypothetical protein